MNLSEIKLIGEWVNLFTSAPVSNEHEIVLQNKSSGTVYVALNTDAPVNLKNTLIIRSGEDKQFSKVDKPLWVKGTGDLAIFSFIESVDPIGSPTGSSPLVTITVPTRNVLGRATLTLNVTPVSLANATGGISVPSNALAILMQADGGVVRFTTDSSNPTETIGMRLDDGVFMSIDTNLADIRVRAQTGTCRLQILYLDKV